MDLVVVLIIIKLLCKFFFFNFITIKLKHVNILNLNLRCDCKAGYTGLYCDSLIDVCTSTSCLNGGTCFSYNVIIILQKKINKI
jgi:hypothetical protein